MDKTQDIVIMIGYGPLLGGLLLAVALLAASLYTQQAKGSPPKPLKEAKGTEGNGVEAAREDTQDAEGEDSAPHIRYIKYYHDLPKEYCCRAMREGVEDLEFIQYCERFDEYSFSSYHGYPLRVMTYCPYCGKEIESLRALASVVECRYCEEKGWEVEEFERYWGLYRKGRSQEEVEGIVEQERGVEEERIKSKSTPPM